jgi:hypothetical protein
MKVETITTPSADEPSIAPDSQKIKGFTGSGYGSLAVNTLPAGTSGALLSDGAKKAYGGNYLLFESASKQTIETIAKLLNIEL